MPGFDFVKMHGCGNDYVLVDGARYVIDDPSATSRRVSDRHTGIGSDGLIITKPSEAADVRMLMYNADGSRGTMCGNGLRCVARRVIEDGICTGNPLAQARSVPDFAIQLSSSRFAALPPPIGDAIQLGLTRLEISATGPVVLICITIEADARTCPAYNVVAGGNVQLIAVELATPSLRLADMNCTIEGDTAIDRPVNVEGHEYRLTCVEVGNQQAVSFVDDLNAVNVERAGRQIAASGLFPDGVNVGFAQVLADGHIRLRVYERGSGVTRACGSGACAAVVAAYHTRRGGARCLVEQPGGSVVVALDDEVVLCGTAHRVFSGRWDD